MYCKKITYKWLGTILISLGAHITASQLAYADDNWKFNAEVYALGADVSATSILGQDHTAEFDDILDNLEFAMFGSVAAKRDKLALIANLLYVDVSASKDDERGSVSINKNVEMEALISTLAAGWELAKSETSTFHGLIGTRVLTLDTSVSIDVAPLGERSGNESDELWDLVLGIQGRADLSPKWYITYYADIGTGDSDSTYQLSTALAYRFSHFDFAFGYQFIEWQFDDMLLDDLKMAGPAMGFRFHW